MRVVVVCDHEPLPTDPGERRLMRAGMLTAALAEAGHEVTWLTSSFDHYLKRQRSREQHTVRVNPRLTIRVLAAPGYPANVSARRVIHNIAFAHALKRALRTEPTPHVVVAALPATESAAAAIHFAEERRIPSILDVYDPWPDSFERVMPATRFRLAAPLIALLDRQARYSCAHATALLAVSEAYLQWGQAKGARSGIGPDRVFPLSYVPARFDEAEREMVLARLGIEPRHSVVSFAGTWGETHDFAPVIAAAKGMSGKHNLRFVLCGNSSEQPKTYRALARFENVALPGWLNARELAMLLSVTDVGLLPYRAGAPQTLPNKVFEYMAYGAFQIGTLRGEAEAIYERTGAGRTIAPTGAALIGALHEYFAGPARAQRSSRIAAFRAYYAGHVVYREMVAHIEQVAAAG